MSVDIGVACRLGRLSELAEGIGMGLVHAREALDMHQFCSYWGAHDIFSYISDCITLVHGTAGCMTNRRFLPIFGSNEPCDYDPHFNTCFNEQDVIFGAEVKLRKAIAHILDTRSPSLLAVITNCCADIIGDDVQGIVHEMASAGHRIVWLHTGGFTGKSYRAGSEEAFHRLADLMEDHHAPREAGTVNLFLRRWIWGETQEKEIAESTRLLGKLGLRINKVMHKGISYADFLDLKRAEANVAQCFYFGMALFDEMAARFGTKQVKASTPVGLNETLRWMADTAATMGIDYVPDSDPEVNELMALREHVRMAIGSGRDAIIWTQTGERMIGQVKLARELGLRPIVVGIDPSVVRDKLKVFVKEIKAGFDVDLFLSTDIEDVKELARGLNDPVIFCNEDYFSGYSVFSYRLANNQVYGFAGARRIYQKMLSTLERRRSRYSFFAEIA